MLVYRYICLYIALLFFLLHGRIIMSAPYKTPLFAVCPGLLSPTGQAILAKYGFTRP
jgi:hypothetical protein